MASIKDNKSVMPRVGGSHLSGSTTPATTTTTTNILKGPISVDVHPPEEDMHDGSKENIGSSHGRSNGFLSSSSSRRKKLPSPKPDLPIPPSSNSTSIRQPRIARAASVASGEIQAEVAAGKITPKLKQRQSSEGDSTSNHPTIDGHRKRLQRLNMPVVYRLYESQCEEYHGTINGPDDDEFRPEEASKALRQALSAGIQCDDKVLIHVLLRHNNFQRQKIAAAYEGQCDRILVADIEEVLGGFFLDCILALLQPAHLYSTKLLHYAISSRSANRQIAVEIALTSTSSQLKVIRDTYYTEYRISLERDLNVKVEGLFGQMLKDLLLRPRDADNTAVDLDYVDHLIEIVTKNDNGIEEIGRNYELFEKIFLNQSLIQLRSFFDRYDTQAMRASTDSDSPKVRDFETAIRKSVNMHSDIRHMILLFIKITRNVQLYFAEKLHEAIIGARCEPSTIIRILVSRSEIDLFDICEEYKGKYGRSIVSDLKETCSGDFYRLLKQLVDPQNNHLSFEDSN